jgi:hypothetical protein
MTPIMIHPKTVFEHAASPHADIRIINRTGLKKLRDSVRAYSVALATSGAFNDAEEVEKQLRHNNISVAKIVDLCTVAQGAK